MQNELKALFDIDYTACEHNGISISVMRDFDDAILSSINEADFAPEVLGVYKKFAPMKQNAPENMKNELFHTIRNFALDRFENNKYCEGLILYRFLAVKSTLFPEDYPYIADALANMNFKNLAIYFMNIYKQKSANKPLMYLTSANFYNLRIQDYKTAIKYYEKYIELDETKAVIYTILGNLYSKVYGDSELEKQIEYFQKAYSLKPNDRTVLHFLAFCNEKLENFNEADKFYQKLLQNEPTETDFYNYGAFLIQRGDFLQGHEYFAHRFGVDNSIDLKYPFEKEKKWDFKTNIKDKTLLIHYEQGYGDTIMYSRFVPQLKGLAKKIIFVVQDSLYDLIKNSKIIPKSIKLISDKENLSKIKYDYNMALLDVPYVLKVKSSQIPLTEGYLSVTQKQISEYSKKYIKKSKNIKIGFAYRGKTGVNYEIRDIEPVKFNIITGLDGFDFYSLQKENSWENKKVTPLGDTFDNFTHTAAAIKNMDIIISTDNVILNLAGALGVKTIGLFNKEPNFRWFKLDGNDTGWYKSVKPLQVERKDHWDEVIQEIINIIKVSI